MSTSIKSGKQSPGLLTMLHELVSTPSVSSTSAKHDQGNRLVIVKLADWLSDLGFAVEIIPIPNQADKANLIATLGTGPGGLVLAGHTDTVPFDEARWQLNPLALTERDNRLYGLGATDMKGFFPIVIEAAKAFAQTKLKQPLIILATADEESSMSGARLLTEIGKPLARHAVIGEPTSLVPIRMHKGIMMEAIRVIGQSGHSSNPALGKNALEVMNVVINDLLAYRSYLQKRFQNSLFEIDVPTLNLGCIHGGDNPNRICNQCELHFDLRGIPGMENDLIREQINTRLQKISAQYGTPIELYPLVEGVEPFEQAHNSSIVKAAERLTGHNATSVAFATEAPFLQQLGMETIVLGPGSINQAHQPDEYMELSQVKPAIAIIKSLIQQFCL
jgi:acetylornithine deacetylase